MVGRTRVVVTGSTGNLGQKAVAALAAGGDFDVVRIGRNSHGAADVITADLTRYDDSWAMAFKGAGAVLHLAADPKPVAAWGSIQSLNIDLALNVFRAAEAAVVPRFIFASSNWVLGGYRFREERLHGGLAPRPVNPYGASKLFIERYGLALAARGAMAVLCLRIGYCQPGANKPGPHMAYGRWGQEMWLGNDDWAQAVVRSLTAPIDGAAVVNVVSRNHGMRWDMDETRAAIGYEAQQSHRPTLSPLGRAKDWGARMRDQLMPRGAIAPAFGARW